MATLGGTLNLKRAVISLAQADLTQPANIVQGGTAGSIGGGGQRIDSTVQEGAFRQYANGNVRLILGTAKTRTNTFALRALTPSQVQTVLGLCGLTVCFRDTYGRKVYGSFLQTDVTDIPLSGDNATNTLLTDIAIQITQVTYSEAV
jgi:hypothetical protein